MSIRKILSKKTIIVFLFLVSAVMTSSTFAYWATYVEGTSESHTMTFHVGSPLYDNHQFVLDSDVPTYRYEIDVEYLLQNPDLNEEEIIFAILWNDKDLLDQYINGEVELTYELQIYKNGKEVNNNTYKRYSKLINIEESDENNYDITSNKLSDTIRININLNEENKRNDYKNLAKYDVYLEITFEVDED